MYNRRTMRINSYSGLARKQEKDVHAIVRRLIITDPCPVNDKAVMPINARSGLKGKKGANVSVSESF